MASGGGWQKEVTLGLQASLGQRDLKLGCSSGTRHLAAGMRHPQDKAEETLSCYSTVCRDVKRPAYHSMPPSVYLSGPVCTWTRCGRYLDTCCPYTQAYIADHLLQSRMTVGYIS